MCTYIRIPHMTAALLKGKAEKGNVTLSAHILEYHT